MMSYRNYSTIGIEEKEAAKEKNKEILSRLKEYFYPLAAKEKKSANSQKLLQGCPDATRDGFLEKSPPGLRRQNHG